MIRAGLPMVTPEELDAVLSREDAPYEIVDGEIVEKPEIGIFARWVGLRLFSLIKDIVESNHLGWAGHELMFILDASRPLTRQPDVSFVSYARWAEDREWGMEGEWDVVPDLAIEIVSPHDRSSRVAKKLQDYFRYGVRQVWHLQPETATVTIYRSPKQVEILDATDTLDGGDILPGFRVPVADLFRRTDRL